MGVKGLNTKKRVEKFKVFDIVMEHYIKCLVLPLKQVVWKEKLRL